MSTATRTRGIAGRAAWLLACFAGAAFAAPEQAVIPSPAELEAQGAVIGRIVVIPADIFDPSIPGESGWLYRTANKLHINTRAAVIRGQLMFKTGDPYDARLIQENERFLRKNDYLYDAQIVPVAFDGHTVDLEVRSKDVWTLNPGFNFGRSGGKNATNIHVQEENLLGTGQKVEVAWDSDVDSTAWTLHYVDPHFLESFTRLAAFYSDADDGNSEFFTVERPFYSLDTRWAAGTSLLNSHYIDDRYELGKKVGEFRAHEQRYEANGGWSRGLVDGWADRWTLGATWQEAEFEPEPGKPLGGPLPPDRKFVYPWIGFERVQDAFVERVNLDQILRTEDVLLGFNGWARLGYASEALGSKTDAVLLSAFAKHGAEFGTRQSLFGSAWVSGRYEHGGIRNGILGAESRYYLATSARSKFFANLSGTADAGPGRGPAAHAGRRHRAAWLSAALPGGHGEGAAYARAALLHELVPVPVVPRRRRGVLRHGSHLGPRRDGRDEPGDAEGRRLRVEARVEPLCVRQRRAHRSRVSAGRRQRHRQRAAHRRDEPEFLGAGQSRRTARPNPGDAVRSPRPRSSRREGRRRPPAGR